MTATAPTDISTLEASVQGASDRLADALAAGDDTAGARAALEAARAALQAHQNAQQAAVADADADHAAKTDAATAEAAGAAVQAVRRTVERIMLPDGVQAPEHKQHPAVEAAAAVVARAKLAIERGAEGRKAAADEVASLQQRSDATRVKAGAIRSRRLAGHEEDGDAAALHLLEADAADLDGMVEAARGRLHALEQPLVGLRQRLAEAEQTLEAEQIEAARRGHGDRLRALEQALIAGVREFRSGFIKNGRTNFPAYYTPSAELRQLSMGGLA